MYRHGALKGWRLYRLRWQRLHAQVPDGYKMVVSAAPAGGVRRALFPLHRRRPSWHWAYSMERPSGAIRLAMVESAPSSHAERAAAAAAEQAPFVYVI